MSIEEPLSPEESPEQRQKRLNPRLLSAASHNNSDAVLALIREGALVTCTDPRHWSSLTWAASHGNVHLTRELIALNAVAPYRKSGQRGHTPLHWAAFKGHVEILWLLLAAGVEPETRDALGNTALHQAAAGGNLKAVETLLAWGVDIHVANDRNHSPLVLSTDAEIKSLLKSALDAKVCASSGKQFSSSDRKLFCQVTRQFYATDRVVKRKKFASLGATLEEELLTVSVSVNAELDGLETELHAATASPATDRLEKVIGLAENKPVNPKLLAKAKQTLKVLKATIELTRAITKERLDSQELYFLKIRKIAAAIEIAKASDVKKENITYAATEKEAIELQFVIFKLFEKNPTDENKFLASLESSVASAERLAAHIDEALVNKAKARIRLIKATRAIRESQATFAKIAEINSLREPLPSGAPESALATEQSLTQAVEDVKALIAEATAAGAEGVSVSAEQLKKLEVLLEERKVIEEELRQKAAKKAKKGSKKAKK